MTSRTPQCKVFWALLLSFKHLGVPKDSKSPTLGVLGFTPTLGQSGVATGYLIHIFLKELCSDSIMPWGLAFGEQGDGFHDLLMSENSFQGDNKGNIDILGWVEKIEQCSRMRAVLVSYCLFEPSTCPIRE
jgi:hypothetical protein